MFYLITMLRTRICKELKNSRRGNYNKEFVEALKAAEEALYELKTFY